MCELHHLNSNGDQRKFLSGGASAWGFTIAEEWSPSPLSIFLEINTMLEY